MYKILGADQNQYGPVSADQLRQWIVEGRANAHTMVHAEGMTEWKPLGTLPEFSLALTGPTPAPVRSFTRPTTNVWAVISLILGIISVTVGLCCCVALPCAAVPLHLLGIVFGIIALVQIRRNPQRYGGRGLALTGLILSLLALLLGIGLMAAAGSGAFEGVFRDLEKFGR